jgi:hypothetical protein
LKLKFIRDIDLGDDTTKRSVWRCVRGMWQVRPCADGQHVAHSEARTRQATILAQW